MKGEGYAEKPRNKGAYICYSQRYDLFESDFEMATHMIIMLSAQVDFAEWLLIDAKDIGSLFSISVNRIN